MDEDTFAAERWVRIMADYCCEGVWDFEGAAGLASDLPIAPELIERLLRWQAAFDLSLHKGLDVTAFAAEGLAIARAVKRALPDWTIVYFDDSKLKPDVPRETFEYEITLANGDDDRRDTL